jgi:hypothetical protein
MTGKKEVSSGNSGDERTPDKRQGQIKYAQGQTKQTEGGAGKPETSKLEPEKQGGIGP